MTLISKVPIVELDGRNLYYTFIAGARKVIEHQVELNKINVFPVNDGDTGTNLASTIRSVIESLHPHRSFKITADRIAEATLVNARGNSGIIFAQFLYGLSNETGNFTTITLKQFADSINKSVRYVYDAVADPIEGTMLTVIKDWADYIYKSRNMFSDFNQMLLESYNVLKKSLSETKFKLKVLAKANVVDAGAKGFVLFVEGIIEFIHSRNIKELILSKFETTIFEKIEEVIAEKVNFRYCTEAIIKNTTKSHKELMSLLQEYGDSAVIAGSEKISRIHVHTDSPADLFYKLRNAGTITLQKADDMIRQSESVYNRKWKIALVTDSTCDISEELIDHYQINMVPVNINFGENHYLDKITIQPEQFYSLLNENPDYPKTSQANEKTFINVYSHLASHYDSIISIHLSDKLSGTFYSSQKAASSISKEFNKPISVINSKGISGSLGLVVLRAAQAIEKGYSHEQIVKMVEKWIKNVKILVSLKTIKFLVRGGRLSYVKGLMARLLNMTPIISIDETGKVIVFDKAFNHRANLEKIMWYMKKASNDKKIWNYIVMHANNTEDADWYTEKMKSLIHKNPVSVVNISPIIGAHAGIGAAAIAFMYK